MPNSIALVVPGSVAAVRTIPLVEQLVAAGHEVSAIVTQTIMQWGEPKWGQRFIDDLSQVTNGKVLVSDKSPEQEAIIRKADRVVVFPSTANMISQIAYSSPGGSPSLTKFLSQAQDRLVFIPAMNAKMWAHPAVQHNCLKLLDKGAIIIGPAKGMAEPKTEWERTYPGYGRVLDTNRIVELIDAVFKSSPDVLEDFFVARRAALARWDALRSTFRSIPEKPVLAIIDGDNIKWNDIKNFHESTTALGLSLKYILDRGALAHHEALNVLAGKSNVYSGMSTDREHIKLTEAAGCIVYPFPNSRQLVRMRRGSGATLGESAYLAALTSEVPVIICYSRFDLPANVDHIEALTRDGVETALKQPGFADLHKRLLEARYS